MYMILLLPWMNVAIHNSYTVHTPSRRFTVCGGAHFLDDVERTSTFGLFMKCRSGGKGTDCSFHVSQSKSHISE